jgi:hypothetical protein
VLTLVVTLNPPGALVMVNTALVTTEDDIDPDNDSDTFVFSLAEQAAPILSIVGLGTLIVLLTLVAYSRMRPTNR